MPKTPGALLATVTLGTLGALGVTTLAERDARADGGHVQALGADLGARILKIDDKSTVDFGGGLGAHYAYQLTNQFNFVAEGTWSLVALKETADAQTPHTRPTMLTIADVGAVYVLDVTRWIPYFGVMLGGAALTGGTLDSAKLLPDAVLGLGVDYLLSHTVAVGVAYRQHMFFTELSTYPVYTDVGLRIEYRWGY